MSEVKQRTACIDVSAGEISWAPSEAKIIIEKTQSAIDHLGAKIKLRMSDRRRGIEGHVRICAEIDDTIEHKQHRLLVAARRAEEALSLLESEVIKLKGPVLEHNGFIDSLNTARAGIAEFRKRQETPG